MVPMVGAMRPKRSGKKKRDGRREKKVPTIRSNWGPKTPKDKKKPVGTPVGALGTPGLEKADVVKRRQADMLERLKSNGWFRRLRGRLLRCDEERCGNENCVEVCAFADWRRRLQQISAAFRLITKADDPVHEVRVVRGIWARPIGDLRTASIAAAKQLNRRALDSLFMPTLVAVGTFKVSPAPKDRDPHWVCEVHQIIAGAKKDELEKAFVAAWAQEKYESVVRVTEVKNLGRALNDTFQVDLRNWQHPDLLRDDLGTPKKAHREEFYRWLLTLSLGERMVRYGCDRYLNRLKKQPRTIRPKVHKPRPYPIWLERHMFGNREQPLRGNFDQPPWRYRPR
jgi:hypothetical protein